MTFDFSKLRGKIREKFNTESAFAEAMEMSNPTLSAKLNGKVCWTDRDIVKACGLLDIPFEFIPVYFFTEKVVSS
jgi:hypothetical protein